MPRKPAKTMHYQLRRHRPLTFSPFARSMATAASRKKSRPGFWEAKPQSKDIPRSSGNGFAIHVKAETGKSHSSDNEEFEGVVQADFVFFDPKPSDFHGVKALLKSYLDNKEWDLSTFVELIVEQPTVGTVVKIEGDEDDVVYSIISALNLEIHKSKKCMIELKNYLLKECQDTDVLSKLKSLVEDQARDVGLLVSQRVVNLPPQLLPPMYDGLFDEVEWATEDEPTEELRNSFRFKYYLIITKIYKHKNAKQRKNGDEDIIYIKPEEELFFELSSWSFNFTLKSQQVTTNELKNYRLVGLVMCVEASKISTFRKELQSLID